MWIRADDIPWMIEYVADEIGPSGSQCVPAIGLEDDETTPANCKVDGGLCYMGLCGLLDSDRYDGALEGPGSTV